MFDAPGKLVQLLKRVDFSGHGDELCSVQRARPDRSGLLEVVPTNKISYLITSTSTILDL